MQQAIPWLFAAATFLYAAFFCYLYFRAEKPKPNSAEWIAMRQKPKFFPQRAGKLTKADIIPLAAITVAFCVINLLNLGNLHSPQTFHRFEQTGESYVIELREPAAIMEILYFTGLGHGRNNAAYSLRFSSDGVNWTEQFRESAGDIHGGMTQNFSQTFRWMRANLLGEQPFDTRFIEISPQFAPLDLGEISIRVFDHETEAMAALAPEDFIIPPRSWNLFDEQELVPERYDILNSTYFDEIYHAYTAFQHLQGETPYENTHPPLGKLITASGIGIFGMTPFGWRFMPALFGILMLPLLYILLKWMFGKISVALCGTLLFAFSFMHFVQTRISTIDVYAVFFILLMSLFMYRYITEPLDAPFWKANLPLILTGLSFGLGAAAKWQSIYAGFGLLALYIIHLRRRSKHYREKEIAFYPYLIATLAVSFASFIIIPGIIYILTYIPYAIPNAPPRGIDGFGHLMSMTLDEFANNQVRMFTYHSGLEATHRFASPWYEWLISWRPIFYYSSRLPEAATRASVWAFTNPLIAWAGIGTLFACLSGAIKRKSHTALFILIGYFSNLIPWMVVSRITFPYHYFPSLLFLCIGITWVFNRLIERDAKRGTRHMLIFTSVSAALFILFYPVLSGVQTPAWYPEILLRWLPNWTF